MAKAFSGHTDGAKYRWVQDACVKAVGAGKAVFPISAYTYIEIGKITNLRQRRDLRAVIEQVCRYMVVTSLANVAHHEIDAVLNQTVRPNPTPIGQIYYLDWGVDRAFGKSGELRVKSAKGEDITEEVRSTHPLGPAAFDAIILDGYLKLNQKAIEGPTQEEEPKFRAFGWRPEASIQELERWADEELAQVRWFDDFPEWRRGRIRDVIIAREVLIKVGDIFDEGFAKRGPGAAERFFDVNRDDLSSIYGGMPSFDVSVTLKTSLHRNPSHRWTNNDIFDISAMALTVPYCDVVVTDNSMWSHLTRHKLPEKYSTAVIYDLAELPNHL